MAPIEASLIVRRLRSVFVWVFMLLSSAALATMTEIPLEASSMNSMPSATLITVSTTAGAPPQSVAELRWTDLTPQQQQALSPLAGEWDKLDAFRKTKWLAISKKYASMKPAEQMRLQERMREWAKLTPEQRRIARESYARTKKLNPAQKSAQWQQYQQLSEEQKKKLAQDASSKKRVAALPSGAAQGKNHKTVPPIKSAPKPVIEQSVTPQAASQSALQPTVPPAIK